MSVAEPIDFTTPVGQVRLLATDLDATQVYLQDEAYTALLNLNNQDVRLAAAQAVDLLASNEAFVQKAVRTLDVSTNGPAVATALQKYAAELRRQVYEGDGDMTGFVDWAEQVHDEFTIRERVVKQYLRLAG